MTRSPRPLPPPSAAARSRRLPAAPRLLAALAWSLCAAALSGCGGLGAAGEDLPRRDVRLLLDAAPSGVHAGIFLASSRGFDRGEGVTLRLRDAAPEQARRLLARERVDAAIMDIHQLALARERGADLVGVMALVQRPLTAVIANPGIRRPADLHGARVAVSPDPGELAALKSVVGGEDLDQIDLLRTARGAEALLDGRVDAMTGRWDVDGVAIAAEIPAARELRVGDHGAPGYPQLVVVVTRYALRERANVVRALIRALQRGYREARIDPESAVAAMREPEPRLEREVLLAQVSEVAPAWTAGASAYGELDVAALRRWAQRAAEYGALRRPPDVSRAFDSGLVGRPRAS